ncbi:MAG: iron-containing alcohol dehydrogenase [Acholeplasmataceae bacterium]
MLNFIYHSPTKLIFGKGQLKQLTAELEPYRGKNVLLVYGKSSIKENGIYQVILDVSKTLKINLFEASGIRANPSLESVISARKTCVEHNIEFVLAAGGGSVVDAAKAICFSVFLDEPDIWHVFLREVAITKALPLGVVLTLSGTGSECNGNTVITNDAIQRKRGFGSPLLNPLFSIIDPSWSVTVPQDPFIASGMDVMMHVFEQYFSPTPHTETSDYMCVAILKSVMQSLTQIIHHDDTYDARANLSWAATIGLNWILQQGRIGDWSSHGFSYPITTLYGITHGFALAMIQPSWMKIALTYNPDVMGRRLSFLGEEIFNLHDPSDVIEAIKKVYEGFGAKTSLLKAGISLTEKELKDMARTVTELGDVGQVVKINTDIAYEIFKDSASS